jgi:hypothetical protein
MNIFFYTVSGWAEFAKLYLQQLQGLPVLEEMKILPAGSLFLSPLSLKLRSGDLLLLYVTNTQELDELLTLKNEFLEFRIILILADSTTFQKAYSLQPRFIVFQDEDMTKVESVIQKMKDSNALLQGV